jgi:hypothetical protein
MKGHIRKRGVSWEYIIDIGVAVKVGRKGEQWSAEKVNTGTVA